MIIGIIGAMKEEIIPLLQHFNEYESVSIGGNVFYKVSYKNSQIIIAYSKIGKIHAASTTCIMILKFSCQKIIFSGVAGALSSDLKIGDILIASSLCQHDANLTAFGHPLGFIPEGKLFYNANKRLNSIAKNVAKSMKINISEGVIASGDTFVANTEIKNNIRENFNALAVEMEGVATACVCDNFNIPFCVFRTISDSADGDADVSFDKFLESSSKISANMVVKMIDELIVETY